MEFKIYANRNKPVFLHIHGECLSAFSFKEEIKELKKDFTIILPILDGHGEAYQKNFHSIEEQCEEILAYLDTSEYKHIQVLSGFSLGGQIALHMLSKRCDLCDYAIIESALLLPIKLTHWTSYASIYTNTLAKQKWFNKFMYYSLFHDDYALMDYHHNYTLMEKANIRATLQATKAYQMPNNLQNTTCKMAFFVGQRERKAYKISANKVHEVIPGSEIYMLLNYSHGEFSLGYPNEYLRFIKSWVQKKDHQQQIANKQEQQEDERMPNWKHIIKKFQERKHTKKT